MVRGPAVRTTTGQLDADARHPRGTVGLAAHAGHHRRPARADRRRLPEAPLPRRHALHRDGDHRHPPLGVPTRPGRRVDGPHRPQPARGHRGDGHPFGPHVVVLGDEERGAVSLVLGPALLFCPADRPERYAKAAERSDTVILDLEDAVAHGAKPAARAALAGSALDPDRTVVRLNAVGTPDFALDCEAVLGTGYRAVMLAKTESPDHVAAVRSALGDVEVVALCETARGVVHAVEIARTDGVSALMWGAEDLVASLGGTSSRTPAGTYRAVALQARSQVLLAAGAADRVAIDAVHVDISDLRGLAEETDDAVASGFAAKACIHPSQVATVRAAFAPDEAEVERARALLTAAENERGVFTYQGRMVDEPILRHARSVLARFRG
ncbi:CoA ester lyase [Vibrio cholerae]|nr:CoA ester lyase [Vibrio cholerae]